MANRAWSNYGRNIIILKKIRAFGIIFFTILIIVGSILIISRVKSGVSNERRELLNIWNNGDYEGAYELSKILLIEKPVDYFLLTINGFSAFQLGISQINNQNTLYYIDESIFSLRKALLHNKNGASNKFFRSNYNEVSGGQVYYVLGKAYWYKGAEYSDLAVKYMEMANNVYYDALDIPEYLGLAYAAHGDYRNSVEAFSRAFIPGEFPTDNLLLSIARSYMAMEEYNMAISYLQRCVSISPDSNSVVISRLMLAEIYRALKEYDNAEKQYISILDETGETAEVHYQLGELYNLQGDTTRARSEWRIAYRQDPLHARARARLNI